MLLNNLKSKKISALKLVYNNLDIIWSILQITKYAPLSILFLLWWFSLKWFVMNIRFDILGKFWYYILAHKVKKSEL